MEVPGYDRVAAATSLLARLLAGISMTDTRPAIAGGAELTPDVSLESIRAFPNEQAVSTVATLPSGDRYVIRVEWLAAESP